MNKKTLVKKMNYGQSYFDTIIQQIIDKGQANEIITQKWTIKDVLQHLTWNNIEVANALKNKTLAMGDFWKQSIDERNEIIIKSSAKDTLSIVQSKYSSSFQELMNQIERLSNQEINSSTFLELNLLKNAGEPRKSFEFILGNSSPHHYLEHLDDLVERFDLNY